MPRGPGKKENYNLDYSRFSSFDRDDDDLENISPAANQKGQQDGPDLQDMLSKMPPELQEAFRLMTVARNSGSEEAQKKANELALRAVARGDANVKRQFVEHLSKENPDAAAKICAEMNKGERADPAKLVEELNAPPKEEAPPIDELKKQMQEGARRAAKQKEALEKQMAEFEKLKSPEEFMRFIQESGMSEADVQRMLSGDEEHMKACFNRAIDKSIGPNVDERDQATEKALEAVDKLRNTLCGELSELDSPEGTEAPKTESKPEPPQKELEPQVNIPMHRLQYAKDDAGKYISVELKCNLPGVTDMSTVLLDVSEKHVRLNTQAPAPLYAVNAGPFPVLIDASGAKAKFSKKKEELTITVPAKA